MSAEYTPTTERVRKFYSRATDFPDLVDRPNLRKLQEDQLAEFDRWLAAHDAEVRAKHKAMHDERLASLMVDDEDRVIDWFASSSAARIARVIAEGQSILDERFADGVFE